MSLSEDEWRAQAVRPIIGPGVNTWLLVRRSDDDLPESDVKDLAEHALAKWLDFGSRLTMRGVKVLEVQVSNEPLRLERPLPFRREDLPELPIVAGGTPPQWVKLKFTSTLPRREMAWPVLTDGEFRPSTSADIMLMQAEAPVEAKPEEKPKDAIDRVGESVKVALYGAAAILAVGFLISALRRS